MIHIRRIFLLCPRRLGTYRIKAAAVVTSRLSMDTASSWIRPGGGHRHDLGARLTLTGDA